jgi:hypothetical protein
MEKPIVDPREFLRIRNRVIRVAAEAGISAADLAVALSLPESLISIILGDTSDPVTIRLSGGRPTARGYWIRSVVVALWRSRDGQAATEVMERARQEYGIAISVSVVRRLRPADVEKLSYRVKNEERVKIERSQRREREEQVAAIWRADPMARCCQVRERFRELYGGDYSEWMVRRLRPLDLPPLKMGKRHGPRLSAKPVVQEPSPESPSSLSSPGRPRPVHALLPPEERRPSEPTPEEIWERAALIRKNNLEDLKKSRQGKAKGISRLYDLEANPR